MKKLRQTVEVVAICGKRLVHPVPADVKLISAEASVANSYCPYCDRDVTGDIVYLLHDNHPGSGRGFGRVKFPYGVICADCCETE